MNRRTLIKSTVTFAAGALTAKRSNFQSSPILDRVNPERSDRLRIWERGLEWRPDISHLKARLLANENPYGPSPKARLAMMEYTRMGNRYGHTQAEELIAKLAKLEGVSENCILLGPGSSDLLEKTATVMFHKGGNVVMADPSYMSLVKTAQYFGAEMKGIPLTEDYAHDLVKMKSAIDDKTRLVYICNPNNPTGSVTSSEKLYQFCETTAEQVPVFVDEAYLEFIENGRKDSMVNLVAKGKNVIVSRTFSKIHGMAGLRVGYIVALPAVIEEIAALSRSNMGMNIASLQAAMASLDDEDFLKMSRHKNAECRQFVAESLTGMGIDYIPSHTNFLMFPLSTDGKLYLQNMFTRGVGVRVFEIDDMPWSRVSIGTMEEMELFVQTLKVVLA
ncbi:MAG: histidinol-phosphate aminotransferase family protein [Saprospiraceae bacterium]|nr:histidinol-phosphate aminotransferase family protein [Saprospiraceae bacterium]